MPKLPPTTITLRRSITYGDGTVIPCGTKGAVVKVNPAARTYRVLFGSTPTSSGALMPDIDVRYFDCRAQGPYRPKWLKRLARWVLYGKRRR